MRTLEDMQRDYEIAKKELEPIENEREKALKKCNELYKEMKDFKLQNGLFHKMEELQKYKGKEISYIELVVREENGELSTKDMYNDEIFDIDGNGHLHYSSYDFGIMNYEEKTRKYLYQYHCMPTYYDFVGYLKIDFYDDEESEETNNE